MITMSNVQAVGAEYEYCAIGGVACAWCNVHGWSIAQSALTTQLISEVPSSCTSLLTTLASMTAWILSVLESVR